MNRKQTILILLLAASSFGLLANAQSRKGQSSNNGTWTLYDTHNSEICGNNISALATEGKTVWAGTYQGLCRLGGANWTDYAMFNEKLKDQSVNCLMIDARGILWIGTDDYGVIEFDGTHWTEHNDVTRRLKMKFVKEMVVDHDGVLWIGVTLGGIISYNGDEWEKYTPDDCGLLSDFVLDLAVDRTNRKWITTNAGVSVFNGSRWISYSRKNSGLPDDIVPAIAIDKSNAKWFGTLNGLARYDGERWKVWNTNNSPLPSNQINDIAIDNDGLLWIGTSNGVAVFDGVNNWVAFTSKNSSIPQGNIYKVAHDDNGNHWFGNDARGLARLSGFVMPGSKAPAAQSKNEEVAETPTIPEEPVEPTPSKVSDERVRINPHLEEGYITISIESASATITFINSDDKVVKTVKDYHNNQHIKINRMPKGMYTVKIKTERGTRRIKFNLK